MESLRGKPFYADEERMSMLADAVRAYGQQGEQEGNALTDRDAYLAYAEACMMNGKHPLDYPQWIAAGKPKA